MSGVFPRDWQGLESHLILHTPATVLIPTSLHVWLKVKRLDASVVENSKTEMRKACRDIVLGKEWSLDFMGSLYTIF